MNRWPIFAKTLNMRYFIPIAIASLMILGCNKQSKDMSTLSLTQEWDKTFPKSELVDHSKVTFHNRYGIELAADMYVPRSFAGAQDDNKTAQDDRLLFCRYSMPLMAMTLKSGAFSVI